MDETALRALFEHAVSAGRPSPQLVGNSVRVGKRIRARRRIGAAAASMSAIALIAIMLPPVSGSLGSGSHHHQPPVSGHGPVPPTAYVWTAAGERGTTLQGSDEVTPVRLATDTPLRPITVRGLISEVAAAPGGRAVYVFSFTATSTSTVDYVTRIDTATNSAANPVRLPLHLVQNTEIRIARGGRVAYTVNSSSQMVAISLATGAVRQLATFNGQFDITPNGRTAYLPVNNGVQPVDLVTGNAEPPVKVRAEPSAMAITPDGKTVWVVSQGNVNTAFVTPIGTATNGAGKPITVPAQSLIAPVGGIVITPDGKTAYVNGGQYVSPVDLAARTAGRPIKLPSVFRTEPGILLMSPNGKVVYDNLRPIDLITNKALPPVVLPRGYADSTVPAIPGFSPGGRIIYLPAVTSRRGRPQEGVLIPISTATQRQAGKIINVGPGSPQQIVIVP
jgi:hypothetical protein